jgi:hypothetical protein
LFEDFLGTMRLSDFSGSFIVGDSLFGLPDADRRGTPPGRTGDLPEPAPAKAGVPTPSFPA